MSKFNIGDEVYCKGKDGIWKVINKTINFTLYDLYDISDGFVTIPSVQENELYHVDEPQSARNDKKDYKDVKDKLPLDLIDPIALKTLGEVLKYGLDKYGWENSTSYQHGEIDTYIGAMLRHLIAYQEGENIDKESNISHLKHLFFNAYVLIYLEGKNNK